MKKASIAMPVICAAAAVLVARYHMKNSGRRARAMTILKKFEEKCAMPAGKLKQIADVMAVEMHAGLASEGGSKLKMLITYVDNLPTGSADVLSSACCSVFGAKMNGIPWLSLLEIKTHRFTYEKRCVLQLERLREKNDWR